MGCRIRHVRSSRRTSQYMTQVLTSARPTFRGTTRLQQAAQRHPTLSAFFGFTALAMLLFHRTWAHPLTRWVGEPGDPPKFMWMMVWNPYAVRHGLNPFFTHHINSVTGVNLLWDTSVALPSWLMTPVTF